LSPEDLETIRREIESFDDITIVDDEIRGIVARNWPHLLAKLPHHKKTIDVARKPPSTAAKLRNFR
jgi:hypothetical protein